MALSAERKAQNEQTFREANAQLERGARELVAADQATLVPFLCECPQPECTQVVLVTLSEYEEVRSKTPRGIAADGHEDTAIERVVARNDRFTVTEKFGRAAEVVEQEGPP